MNETKFTPDEARSPVPIFFDGKQSSIKAGLNAFAFELVAKSFVATLGRNPEGAPVVVRINARGKTLVDVEARLVPERKSKSAISEAEKRAALAEEALRVAYAKEEKDAPLLDAMLSIDVQTIPEELAKIVIAWRKAAETRQEPETAQWSERCEAFQTALDEAGL